MTSTVHLIGTAWKTYQEHEVLNRVALWLFFLPLVASGLMETLVEAQFIDRSSIPNILGISIVWIAISLLVVWGEACVLVLGRSLLGKKVKKMDFPTLRTESKGLILPIFLTEILYTCFMIFWAILLIIPGLIYGIRAAFYYVVIAADGVAYREALLRSKKVVTGRTWDTLIAMITIAVVLFVPIMLGASLLQIVFKAVDERLVPIVDVLLTGATSIASIIAILSMILLYQELKSSSPNT